MKKWIGKVIILIGVIHLIFGFITFRAAWAEMLQQGFFNTVAGHLGHNIAFWFIAFAFLTLILGGLIDWCEGNKQPLPRFLGWSLLALSFSGVVMMPISGWWLLLIPAIGSIRQSGKAKKTHKDKLRGKDMNEMKLPNTAHTSRPWLIRDIVPDFTLEDVWALPAHGSANDFQTLLEQTVSGQPEWDSLPARFLWRVRDRLGRWFGLGSISDQIDEGRVDTTDRLPIPGTNETSLAERLPSDLRNTAADLHFDSLPFKPLYRTDIEFAAELSNRTVHSVMHLAWVDQGEGRYQGQMAVYVNPRGRLGKSYMALIKPFRYWIVYPALMRQIEREWNTRVPR